MSFEDHYLPYFRKWFITCLLSAILLFQHLFTDSWHGDQPLAPHPLSVLADFLPLLLCASYEFVVYYLVFVCVCIWGCQSAQGAMLVFLRSCWGNTA
jgi:hypothetical protein